MDVFKGEQIVCSDKYEIRKIALIKLLIKNPTVEFSRECVKEIQQDKLDAVHSHRGIEIYRIKGIYSVRSKHAKKLNHPIYGFEKLLTNLENTNKEFVNIHSVEGDKYTFTIFTDEKLEELFGLIAIDESTEWRDRPRPFHRNFLEPKTMDGSKLVLRDGGWVPEH